MLREVLILFSFAVYNLRLYLPASDKVCLQQLSLISPLTHPSLGQYVLSSLLRLGRLFGKVLWPRMV